LIALPAALSATDRIALLYLAGLAALAVATHPQPSSILLSIAAIAAAILGAARAAARSPRGRLVHDFLPVLLVIAIFSVSGPVIATANPSRWDARLAALDRTLFGSLPEAWVGLLGRPVWLDDLASALYASYYVIPVVMGVTLYRRGLRREFEHFSFCVVATFLLSYAGYLIAPAYGPRVPAAEAAARLGGGPLTEALRSFLATAELNQLDAFPSGHTALSLVFVWLGWRRFPRWRPVLIAFALGIVFSAVYLSLHYVIDIVAGAALATVMPCLGPFLERRLAARPAAGWEREAVSGRR